MENSSPHRRTAARRLPYVPSVRLDTHREADYDCHGGVLPYVLRSLLGPSRIDR
jgi:hypothetical protein